MAKTTRESVEGQPVTIPSTEDAKLLDWLNRHPGLKARVQSLAAIVADQDGDLVRADEAERRVIEEVRRLWQDALQGWAESQLAGAEVSADAASQMRRAGKNLCWRTTFGPIHVSETLYRFGTRTQRRFAGRAGVSHRGCSQPLQRVVTDFGADVAFGQVVEKLREHYGVVLAAETIRCIVEGHARVRFEQQRLQAQWPRVAGGRGRWWHGADCAQ